MIKKPKIGMYVFKRNKSSGKYVLGKIIATFTEILIIDIMDDAGYAYGHIPNDKYAGDPYISIHTGGSDYEIIYANNEEEILAKVL